MKAIVMKEPGCVVLEEKPVPEPQPGFVRVRVKAAAICATDLEVADGNIPASYPITPGHEWSGIVDAAGSEEDSRWIGKRVVGSNDVVCLKCEACRRGEWRYCPDFEEIGFKRDGAYAEYVIVPAYGLCELPEQVSFVHGALCEPLGVALGTLEGTPQKEAIVNGQFIGSVTQSPLMMGYQAVKTLVQICDGETVSDTPMDGYWYSKDNMEDANIAPNLYD